MKQPSRPSGPAAPAIAARPIRAVLAIAGFGLAVAAGLHATVHSIGRSRPEIALAISPQHPRALNRLALGYQAIAARVGKTDPRIGALARRSLNSLLLNPQALRVLAISHDGAGERAERLALLEIGNRLSRRDEGTQALLIDTYIRQQDLTKALRSIDILLRTNEGSRDDLFPILQQLLITPELQPYLRGYLKERPAWITPFLIHAATTTDKPGVYADLLLETGGLVGLDRAQVIKDGLIARLIDIDADYRRALRIFLLDEGMSDRELTDPAVTARSVSDADNRLLWQLYVADNFGAEAVSTRIIFAYATSPVPQVVARKLIYVTPGEHTLSLAIDDLRLAAGGKAAFGVFCAAMPGRPESRLFERSITIPHATVSRTFTVPGGCEILRLDITLSGSEALEPSELLITRVEMDRLGPFSRPR